MDMIVKRRKGTGIRRYFSDNGEILGVAGTVAGLESLGVLSHSGRGPVAAPDMWCCCDMDGNILRFVRSVETTNLLFYEINKERMRGKS